MSLILVATDLLGFNPHNELQAMARAHRIGQKQKVMVYQFVTSNSVEDAIHKRSKQKIALETIVVKKKDTSGLSLKEINNILSYGTKSLFEEEDKEEISKYYSDEVLIIIKNILIDQFRLPS